MIVKPINEITVKGKLMGFGRFGLEEKVNANGETKIYGSILVATDAKGLNIVEAHFMPQAKLTSKGKENKNYSTLKKIIEEKNTIEKVGLNKASAIKINGNLTVNSYYKMNTANSEPLLVEETQIKGSFIEFDNKAADIPSCGFNLQCLIQNISQELSITGEETGREDVRIQVFDDYKKIFMPMLLKVENPEYIAYINSAYTPMESYTILSGVVNIRTIERNEDDGQMAFGESAKVNKPKTFTEFMITGGKLPEEMNMTEEEMEKVKQNRNLELAKLKTKLIEKNQKPVIVNSGFPSQENTASPTQSAQKYVF